MLLKNAFNRKDKFQDYSFRERREGERGRNISVWLLLMRPLPGTWSAIQACALTENRTDDALVLRLALSPLSHTSQDEKTNFKALVSKQPVKASSCRKLM